MRPIGYYVHHQGVGHWQRATALARRLRHPCTLIGTLPPERAASAPCPVLALPDDAPEPGTAFDPGGVAALHYAPRGHAGLRARSAAIAGWIAARRPALMVVDVSVETVLLARLCATPVLSFRLAGHRDDLPHRIGFEASEALIAPFPAALEGADTLGWVREKSFHAGFLAPPPEIGSEPEDGSVLVIFGRGGAGGCRGALAAAARAVPERRWRVLGPVSGEAGEALPPNLEILGWSDQPAALMARASLVVGGGGDGVLAEVAALGRRFLCLPEPRPFDEQLVKARRLAEIGAAVVREGWPEDGAWPGLLREAMALNPSRLGGLFDPSALDRTAGFIDGQAERAVRLYG